MKFDPSPILITGVAGFIGAALAKKLISQGEKIIGIDSLNSYYDVNLKYQRLNNIKEILNNQNQRNWEFIKLDLTDYKSLHDLFNRIKPKTVINLVAQLAFVTLLRIQMHIFKVILLGS